MRNLEIPLRNPSNKLTHKLTCCEQKHHLAANQASEFERKISETKNARGFGGEIDRQNQTFIGRRSSVAS